MMGLDCHVVEYHGYQLASFASLKVPRPYLRGMASRAGAAAGPGTAAICVWFIDVAWSSNRSALVGPRPVTCSPRAAFSGDAVRARSRSLARYPLALGKRPPMPAEIMELSMPPVLWVAAA